MKKTRVVESVFRAASKDRRCVASLALAVCVVLAMASGGCRQQQEQWASLGGRARLQQKPSSKKLNQADAALDEQTHQPQLDAQAGLPEYLAYAAEHNPGLESAFNRWQGALQRVPQVKALPDPRLTYRYYIRQVETRVGAQRQSFELAQRFPWFGKLDVRGQAAAAQAQVQHEQFQARKLELFYQVKDAYYEYYYLARAIATIKANRDLMKHFERVARTRYKVAAGSHPNIIRAQVELGKLEDRLRSLQAMREPIVARLNAALNRPARAPLGWPGKIHQRAVNVTDGQLLVWLGESNPELRSFDSQIARNQYEIDLARKEYFPDVTFGVNYIDTASSTGGRHPSDDGQDAVIAMASVNLPIWWDKIQAGVNEARYRKLQAVYGKAERANMLRARLKLVLYKFRDAERKMNLYGKTLLPKARESIKATETSFRTGRGGFLDLIDAERILLEFQLANERALANRAQRLAELEMLIGREIPKSEPVLTATPKSETRKEIPDENNAK